MNAAQFLTILTDSAAQVDRARPADDRDGPEWNGPGSSWWESFIETVEGQIKALIADNDDLPPDEPGIDTDNDVDPLNPPIDHERDK